MMPYKITILEDDDGLAVFKIDPPPPFDIAEQIENLLNDELRERSLSRDDIIAAIRRALDQVSQ